MKILIVVDKMGTAIDRLAQSVKRNLIQHQIIVAAVHPKRNDVETLVDIQKLMIWADIIDIHYWKSGEVLRTSFPAEFNAKPKLLFHFNPYDATNSINSLYKIVVVGNEEIHNNVSSAYLIPYGIDLSFFKFNQTYTESKQIMMSVNRIEGKKGILEVARVCNELGYPFKLVGRVSKVAYIKEVMEISGNNTIFVENATDEELRKTYYESALHICNSVDSYESGTLPILEAMACGTPVLTRMIGMVPDLFNGGNMDVRSGQVNDLEDLKMHIKNLMENREWRLRIREKAFDTVRVRDERRMSIDINKLYYKIYKPEIPLVSIIIPTKDSPESFAKSLLGAIEQDYLKFEIIVADSGEISVQKIVNVVKQKTTIPIRYIHFDSKGNYTLAEARNRAVIEADGELLVFCDDRLKMKKNAVSVFATYKRPKAWLWGMKDKAIKGFIENFSSIHRDDIIKLGMFNERMQWYGGMSQEIRERFENKNSIDFIFMQEAEADEIKRTKSKSSRREDIIEAKLLIHKLYYK